MFNIMICNITNIRIRLSICTSSEVVLSSICSLKEEMKRKHQSSWGNEDEAPWRKTNVAVERYCQKGPESLEHQGGMSH